MSAHPVLTTKRLVLRSLTPADANDVQLLAGDREIAANTALIPHPYEDGVAESWIEATALAYAEGRRVNFGITLRSGGALIGSIGLGINRDHQRAELGYWIGKPYWGQGFATEAACAVLEFGFRELGLHRIFAHHLTRNPASGRVMQKAGMLYEGTLRGHVLKWGVYEDIAIYGIVVPAR